MISRRQLLRTTLALFGVILGLLAVELFLRFLPSERLGFHYEGGYFDKPQEYEPDPVENVLGFHDVQPVAKGRKTRVMLLGDSYVAARTVSLPHTVGKRLQHHLNELSDREFDVYSLGQPGWGQKQQLAALRRHGERLRPDIVITLFLPFNDVRDNSEVLNELANAQFEEAARIRPGWTRLAKTEAPAFLFEWSVLNRLVSHRLAKRAARRDPMIPVDYLVYAQDYDQAWQDAWARTEDLIRQTRDMCARVGKPYAVATASTPHGVWGPEQGLERLVAAYPEMKAREWDLDEPTRRLQAFCESEGIAFLSLEPEFRRATQEGQRLHWKYDGHWNPRGHDLAGRLLARFVLDL